MASRKGKRVVMLSLVLALAAVCMTLWTFRVEVRLTAQNLYWRWMNVEGALGIVVEEVVPRPGLRIKTIGARSPANVAFEPGDILFQADGNDLKTLDDLWDVLRGRRAGERVHFLLVRGREALSLYITLQPMD